MGIFDPNSKHFTHAGNFVNELKSLQVEGVNMLLIYGHAMEHLDRLIGHHAEEVYKEAVRLHTQRNSPHENLGPLDLLKSNRTRKIGGLGSPSYISYNRDWVHGVKEFSQLEFKYKLVQIKFVTADLSAKNRWGKWGSYGVSIKDGGEQGEIVIDPRKWTGYFTRQRHPLAANKPEALVHAAINQMAGTILHEFLHAQHHTHPSNSRDPAHKQSVNELGENAVENVLDAETGNTIGLPLYEVVAKPNTTCDM